MSQSIPTIETALAATRVLAATFAKGAAEADRQASLPVDNFKALHAAGVLSLVIRKDQGGLGGGLEAAIDAVSTVAQGEPATALILAMHYIQHGQIAFDQGFWPTAVADVLIRSSLERGALINAAYVDATKGSLSHGALPETVARQQGGQWLLSGHKKYVTGIDALSWIRVAGVTDEPQPRVGYFLVPADAPGIRVERTWDTLGMRATSSQDVIFDNVPLPLEHFFGAVPVGAPRQHGPLDAVWYLALVAAVYHGVAQAARNAFIDFTTGFIPGSLGAPLASLPRFQDALGEIEAAQRVSHRLLFGLGRDYDELVAREDRKQIEERLNGDADVARLVVLRNSAQVTALALELAGNQGLSRNNALERHHRDALSAKAHGPNASLLKAALVRYGLKQQGKEWPPAAPAVPAAPAAQTAQLSGTAVA
ncbi:acyl-CoA dehydrogenase [Corticibacter populi]|uniref:Acyl-CoA dehydrogenase n=1 Tax=Corticibacter populi TaxID=1550736 RepID=A0A3M6QS45_9BURK|nr:acyl-CoA dehydrogenase [Corticibacter populi]RMX05858.1 acyl-CoA dehydrogenase [Corticibacter populi]RZS30824.1 alkylation response protein AidB-like acyl-CoA dehydrogenase [Corticibacter populi]